MELVNKELIVVIAALVFTNEANALTCLNCDEQNCRDVNSLQCKGGTTLDPCGCCMVCAKVEGESCGGPWNIAGVCDTGLICSPKSDLHPGRCINPTRKRIPSKLPKCIQKYKKGRSHRCTSKPTVFCTQCCERCCLSSTGCNPDWDKYIPRAYCKGQMRLHGPRRIKYRDQMYDSDGNDDDADEPIDNKIKA